MAPKKPVQKFATVEQLNSIEETLGKLVDLVTPLVQGKPVSESAKEPIATQAREKEIVKAVSDQAPINLEWEETTKEIVGDALDHCEVFYPKKGGTIFTIVIKKDMSNAPDDYLQRHKSDRRSRELGNEGIEGVIQWATLVRDNLKRPKK